MDKLNYGVIGNCCTAALISDKGSIDWLCFPNFDSPSIFASLLDREKGGYFGFEVSPDYQISQSYVPHTNILSTNFVSEENELSMKQLVSDMESGKVECVLWNEVKHFGDEEEYRKKNEYKIWVNDTYSKEGYKVKEEVYQVIRGQAIKNNIELIEIPIGGGYIDESEFDIILKYEKAESIEAEQETLFQYSRSVKTNLGIITISGEKKLSEIQNFASKYGLSVNVTKFVRRTIISILMIISILSLGIASVLVFITLKASNSWKEYIEDAALFVCLCGCFSGLVWIIMEIVDGIISIFQ